MEIRFMVRSLAAVAVSAALAVPALADTVILNNFTYLPASSVNVTDSTGPDYSGQAGQFSGVLNGNAFVTFCTEIGQTFNFNQMTSALNTYSVISGSTAWGAAKSTAIDQLMSYASSMSLPNNANTSAAVQSAIWEVLNEDGPSYSFITGNFLASSSTAATQTALNSMNLVLASLGSQAITQHVDQLHNGTQQDFLVMAPVPEPETYAMLLAGLGIVGAVARRRRSAEA
jgi:hypothetical protein